MKKVFVTFTLKKTVHGGKKLPIVPHDKIKYGCPLYFKDIPALYKNAWDCKLIFLEEKYGSPIYPGQTVDRVEFQFLSPDIVIPHLYVGTKFDMWEAGIIGHGKVIEIID